jgi:2-hydroxymuconate-semialdehyde hydrolase
MSPMLERKSTPVEGIRVQYWEGGSGFPLLMLHGVGPGTSIQGNFGPVLEPLAARCRIVATDLIGFGGSDRKATPPYFDVELWLRQAAALLELLPSGPCGVAGHSLGGALALKLAARTPRITKVLTSSAVGARYALPDALDAFWSLPADKTALRNAMSRMVYDQAAVTDAMIDDRWGLIASGDSAAYFAAMFEAPRQRYLDAAVVTGQEFAAIEADVVMLHGRDDQPCPAEATTLAMAARIRHADVHLLGRCGHNLPRERPAAYVGAEGAVPSVRWLMAA